MRRSASLPAAGRVAMPMLGVAYTSLPEARYFSDRTSTSFCAAAAAFFCSPKSSRQTPNWSPPQWPEKSPTREGDSRAETLMTTTCSSPRSSARREALREAALWSAASEVVRLAPDDPLAVRILQEFERARSGPETGEDARNFAWF